MDLRTFISPRNCVSSARMLSLPGDISSGFQKQLQIGQLYAFSLFHVLILIAIDPYPDQF